MSIGVRVAVLVEVLAAVEEEAGDGRPQGLVGERDGRLMDVVVVDVVTGMVTGMVTGTAAAPAAAPVGLTTDK